MGLRAELLAAAGGGAGLNDRKNAGQALGGRAEQGDPTTKSLGGHSEGGAGYKFNGQYATSFLNGATGGYNGIHWGGFGGGGRPYNGGGGGGGYDGGDCTIGGRDHDCYGGSSFGDELEANRNSGPGKVEIAVRR